MSFTHRLRKTEGLMTTTTTRLVTINARVMALTRKMLPRLAGNRPRMIQYYDNVNINHVIFTSTREVRLAVEE